jgi:CspA family cold shock protein
MSTTKGTVKWFNNAKGYGFILSEANQEDIFAHYSAIEMEGYKSLKAGQQVMFEVQFGAKGVHATHIRPVVSEAASAPEPVKRQSAASAMPPMTFSHMRVATAEQQAPYQAHGTA